jgi:hypothetical protein
LIFGTWNCLNLRWEMNFDVREAITPLGDLVPILSFFSREELSRRNLTGIVKWC